MLPSLIEQVTAATGARIDPMQKYNIKQRHGRCIHPLKESRNDRQDRSNAELLPGPRP